MYFVVFSHFNIDNFVVDVWLDVFTTVTQADICY